ncbi:MAG: peptide chain release factor N(5)-glutamine methyltransferase, partial [Clostridia bacterium]|nr:peptide chain release factor N(5)-glutamine methyltransferase [Clostridia bacterium]
VDIYSVVMFLGVAIGLVLAVGLFVVAPQLLTNLLNDNLIHLSKTSVWFNLIEGGIRILIFISYILLTGLLKDIRRTYMYHGAEHKTISCYEYGWDLTVENVKKSSRVHDRCGTTFMFLVMAISILVFSLANSFIGVEGVLRVLLKIALLPLVAGISYEVLKLLSKSDFPLLYIFKWPGLTLQLITTKEPSDDMIECAITAFKTVLDMEADPSIEGNKFVIATPTDEVVKAVGEKLKKGGVDEPAEAEWIVSQLAGKKRSELDTKDKLPAKTIDRINAAVEERLTGRPLWYVLGDTEFYGYKINVDESVLIPRPETEELVENALKSIDKESRVLDMCTGSGAIAIAVQKTAGCVVDAADVSGAALETAKKNASQSGADVNFILSDMFASIDGVYDVMISNPPYVKTADVALLPKECGFEPRSAFDGGEDGLDFYRVLSKEAGAHLKVGGVLFMECGYDQKEAIIDLFKDFSSVECIRDINGKDRIIKAVR